jgi:hypothetical protein
MNTISLRLSGVIVICFFTIFLFSCRGSIEGQLIIEESGTEYAEMTVDEWPGDTTSKSIVICLEDEDGEEVCTEIEIQDLDVEAPIEPPGDTISFNFRDLRRGNYQMGIFLQETTEGATPTRELVTWYHSDLDTLGAVLDKGSSETISISFLNLNVNLGVIRVSY